MLFRPLNRSVIVASLLASTALPASLLGGALLLTPALLGTAQALTQDVVLDALKIEIPPKADSKAVITIKKVSVEGTNLSKDEVAKLFDIATSPDDARSIVAKMTAAKISMPEISIAFEGKNGEDLNKGTVVLRDLNAAKVDQGKVGKIAFGGADIAVKTGDIDTVKGTVGSYSIDDMDFSTFLAALKSGDLSKATVKYSKVSFSGLDLNIADKETPAGSPGGNIIHVKAGAANASASYEGDIARKMAGEMQSVSIEFPKASAAGKALASFGYDKLDIGMKVGAAYDPAAKKMSLDEFTFSGVGAGVLTFKGQFGSVDPSLYTGDKDARIKALMGMDFSALSLRFVNAGLAEKGLAFAATMQKKSADALKGDITGMAKAVIPTVLGGDVGKKVAEAVAAFIAAPKSLSADVKVKSGSLKFTDLAAVAKPQDILPKIDLNVVANQ